MLPSVLKLVSDVQHVLAKPKQEAIKLGATKATEAAARSTVDMIKPVHQRISVFKDRHVVNNDDIATVAAVADILYCDMLQMEVNGLRLNRQAPDGHLQTFPAAFFFSESAVRAEEQRNDAKVKRLRNMRTLFKDVIPGLMFAVAGAAYMDIKGLASSFSSMAAADGMLVKQCLDTCKNGVSVAENGLRWSNAYEHTIEQFLDAHQGT